MKILIVIDTLGSGGAQKLKVKLAKGLKKRGHIVEFFIYDSNYPFYQSELENAGIKINIYERTAKGFSFKVLLGLRKLLKKSNFDIVISSLHAPSIYAAFAKLGLSRLSLIICEESSSNAPVPFYKRFAFYLSSLISNFLVVNSYHEAKLKKQIPGRKKKIKVIWNGFDINEVQYKENNRNDLKKILIVGRQVYAKNGLNLMKGLSLFESRNDWLPSITWIGRRDDDKRSSKDIKSIEMQKNMDFYLDNNKSLKERWKWVESVENIYDYYESHDVLIIPSIYEGLPLVLCEAMLSGCFVIASSVCDHPKIIGKDERGILCDPLSHHSICFALEKLIQTETQKRIGITEEARNYAEKNFDFLEMLNKYESLFNQN
tara:strand:+ start:13939 stop:15060 length:1122 start_codon:yes stop_codon:yes gene_type:complete